MNKINKYNEKRFISIFFAYQFKKDSGKNADTCSISVGT